MGRGRGRQEKETTGEETEATLDQMTRFSSFLDGQLDDGRAVVAGAADTRGGGGREESQSTPVSVCAELLLCCAVLRCKMQGAGAGAGAGCKVGL